MKKTRTKHEDTLQFGRLLFISVKGKIEFVSNCVFFRSVRELFVNIHGLKEK